MSHFRRFSEGLWSYISPKKTQARREKPFKAPNTPPPRAPSDRLFDPEASSAVSSSGRRRSRTHFSPSSTRLSDGASHIGSGKTPVPRSADYLLSPTPTRGTSSCAGDLEGDTLLIEPGQDVVEDDDSTFYDADDVRVIPEDMWSGRMSDSDQQRQKYSRQAAIQKAWGWSESAIEIYRQIGMRGFEPILPSTWKIDFYTFPHALFSENENEVYINSVSCNDFRATRALQEFIEVGPKIRAATRNADPSRGPEKVIRRAVETYMRWAQLDGNVNTAGDCPFLFVQTGSPTADVGVLKSKLIRKMDKTAKHLRKVCRASPSPLRIQRTTGRAADSSDEDAYQSNWSPKMPTLYGIVASYTIAGIMAYDLAAEPPALHNIAFLNYKSSDYDVWNSLALALLCVHIRNDMIDYEPFIEASPKQSLTPESDLDA